MTTLNERLRDTQALLIAARLTPWPKGPHSPGLRDRVGALRSDLRSKRSPDFAAEFAKAREACKTLAQCRVNRESLNP